MNRRRPWMDEELQALSDTATRFFETECASQEARSAAQHHVDRDLWRRAGAVGPLRAVATAAMAKWWTTDTLCRIADDGLQLHGGAGYMRGYPNARIYADSRGGRICGGSNEVMKEVVVRDLERAAGVSARPKARAAARTGGA